MYDSLSNDSELKTFLKTYYPHLLEPLPNNTNLIAQKIESLILNQNNKYKVKSEKNSAHPINYRNLSGVYLFVCNSTKAFYIGSALNFLKRFQQHLNKNVELNNHKFYSHVHNNGGWTNFLWFPIYSQPNLIIQFTNLYPNVTINSKIELILSSFTLYQIRIIEQALISYYHPNLNTQKLVNFSSLKLKLRLLLLL